MFLTVFVFLRRPLPPVFGRINHEFLRNAKEKRDNFLKLFLILVCFVWRKEIWHILSQFNDSPTHPTNLKPLCHLKRSSINWIGLYYIFFIDCVTTHAKQMFWRDVAATQQAFKLQKRNHVWLNCIIMLLTSPYLPAPMLYLCRRISITIQDLSVLPMILAL
jgi:hypothetical protein